MALTDIEKVRINVGDTEPGFPLLDDSSYEYFLEANSNNIQRASVDAARAILFQLSVRGGGSESVDIFTIRNTSPSDYRQALLLFINNPSLNPLYANLKGWFGGVSRSEMLENDCTLDNNIVNNPTRDRFPIPTGPFNYTWRL